MEYILEKIFHETESPECPNIYIFGSQQNKIMVKPRNKNKNIADNLRLINSNAILRKELELIPQENSADLALLKIENDNDFVIKAKVQSDKITSNNRYSKSNKESACLGHKISNNEIKDCIINDIIDIQCKQKTPKEHMKDNELKNDCAKIIQDQSETTFKPPNSLAFTNDLKSDLESFLIMMAVSSTCGNNDKTNYAIQNYQETHIIDNDFKNQKTNTFLEELNNDYEMSNLLKIEAIKITTADKNNIVMKYAYKWMDYVKKQRERNFQSQKLLSINKFLDKLEKRKVSISNNVETVNDARLQARDYNTYQHRYKVQKHIIALQKAKLEQQHKIIEELKYNKVLEASRQSLDNMREDVKQTYYNIDKHLKPKIKCLTNELKIREIEENSLVLHCLKVPQFLQRMEARAREREEKHAIIRERRKQMEEDRIRLKQQAEIAKAEMDKEEKLQRIKELREKRRREKIENIRKKQYAERLRALIVMADLHYEKSLTAKYGIRPLKLIIELKHDNMEKAKAHYQFQLKKNILLHWMWHTEDMWYERNYKADDFNRKKLLTKAFNCFKENHNEFLIKLQVAKDYSDLYVTQIVFKGFQKGIHIIREEFAKKWKNAIIYYDSNLLFRTLTCWRTLPALNALKREQDARKLRWRQKVLQVVPDYVPPDE